jgi:hypothetical protein
MNAKDTLNLFNEMGNKGFEQLNALGELNLKAWERFTARQLDAVNLMMEQGVRQMKLATESKGYNDYLKGHVELARETGERLMAETKTNLDLAGTMREDYRAWFQRGVSDLTAEIRKPTTSA